MAIMQGFKKDKDGSYVGVGEVKLYKIPLSSVRVRWNSSKRQLQKRRDYLAKGLLLEAGATLVYKTYPEKPKLPIAA